MFPYEKARSTYQINPMAHPKELTIEYEPNIFGLKGPRKMKVFVPREEYEIAENKGLNELFAEQTEKSEMRIDKYCNKTPKWNEEIKAYVLNFRGRATVSSVKNFLISKVDAKEEDPVYVLFGKAGKELFNLDIKHPFSILQGLAMAISSFDKKLMC